MSLKDIHFKRRYRPRDDRLNDFYIPALSQSIRYDRSAGYFSSAAIAIAAAGVSHLVQGDGKMRLLVGAQLDAMDVEAIEKGASLEEKVSVVLLHALEAPAEDVMRSRLEILAWMVAEGNLDIKVVLPLDESGNPISFEDGSEEYFHPKEGVFTDGEGNQVAFEGSVNESTRGWTKNYEKFTVFTSWGKGKEDVKDLVRDFNRLWNNAEDGWLAIDIPTAVKERLLIFRPPERPPPERIEPKQEPVTTDLNELLYFQFIKDAPYLSNSKDFGFATSAITPWPHQKKVAEKVIEAYPSGRLLCDEVGLGKTIEVGLVLRQVVITGLLQRILILVPRGIARQWQEELYEKFSLNVPFYDGSNFIDVFKKTTKPKKDNPLNENTITLMSWQLARSRDRRNLLMEADPWDLVIVDEVHHARRKHRSGKRGYEEPEWNQFLRLLRGLKEAHKARCLLMATATPMQTDRIEVWDLLKLADMGGKWGAFSSADNFNFMRFFDEMGRDARDRDWNFILSMVRDYLACGGERDKALEDLLEKELGITDWWKIQNLLENEGDANDLPASAKEVLESLVRRYTPLKQLMFRNTRDTLRRYKEQGLFDEDIPERKVEEAWVDMTPEERELYEKIDEYLSEFYRKYEDDKPGRGFVMTIYRRRLTSSFEAIEKSLKTRLEMLRGLRDSGELKRTLDEDSEYMDEDNEGYLEWLEDKDGTIYEEEIDYIDEFVEEIQKLSSDSKFERLCSDIPNVLAKQPQLLIFTQYVDTMDYLREKLLSAFAAEELACYSGRRGGEIWNGEKWVVVSKDDVKKKFKDGVIKIMVCTDAASEGLNFQTCGTLINYDMPWNPMRAEQRIGRLDRIGQRFDEVKVLNYFYRDSVEADVYKAIRTRIREFIMVIGDLQPIIEEIMRIERSRRQERLEELIKELERRMEELKRTSIDTDEYASAADLGRRETDKNPLDLQTIAQLMVHSEIVGHRFEPHPTLDEAYVVNVEKETKAGTFSRDVYDAHPSTLSFFTYGNSVFDDLLGSVNTSMVFKGKKGITLRVSTGTPIQMVDYFVADEDGVKRVEDFVHLKDSAGGTTLDDNQVQMAMGIFRKRVEDEINSRRERIRKLRGPERVMVQEEMMAAFSQAVLIKMELNKGKVSLDEKKKTSLIRAAVNELVRDGDIPNWMKEEARNLTSDDPYYYAIKDKTEASLRELLRNRIIKGRNLQDQLARIREEEESELETVITGEVEYGLFSP